MPLLFNREIDKLRRLLLSLSASVEDNLRAAVRAVMARDTEAAQRVIEQDRDADRREVDIEEECLKILALYQPVANDLRYIVAILKMNHDLERVGDMAGSIAERAEALARAPDLEPPFDLSGLAARAQSMLSRALDAVINLDARVAREVCAADDEVDAMNRNAYAQIAALLRRRPECVEGLLALLSVSRNLERVADHATNIAKDVLYIVGGEILRHRPVRESDGDAQGPEGPLNGGR